MNALLFRLRGFLDDLSLRTALTLALIAGLVVPLGLASLIHFSQQRSALLERQAADHARAIEVLALGMQTPLWELRPEAGRPLIDALMLDPRITRIEIASPLVPEFLAQHIPTRRLGEERTLTREVSYEGRPIGQVRVSMDTGLLAARLTDQWIEMLGSGVAQLLTVLLIVLTLMRYKVLRPLRLLVEQSRVLAAGVLDRALEWRRADELGELGRSFEETRLALRNLVADLDRRNQALSARERELRVILDNMTDGITLVDRDLKLVAWNRRLLELLSTPPESVRPGMSIKALVEPDLSRRHLDPQAHAAVLTQLLESFRPDRASTTHDTLSDGRRIEIRRRPIPGGGFVSTYTDVTEPLEARRQAEESRHLLEAVMDAVPAMIHVKDRELRYRMVNRQYLQWWHLRQDQVLGRDNREMFQGLNGERGGQPRYAQGRGPRVEELPALLENISQRDRWVLDHGKPLPFYETLYGDGGDEPSTIWTTKVPLVAEDGRASHIVTVSIDISARKQAEAELARHREALHQNEKLSALGGLLAGVAHELNNPLSVVVGRAIMLEEQLRDTAAERSIGKIRGAAERCARIVKTFLAMARHQDPAREPVRLDQVVQSALDLVGYGLAADGIEVEVRLDPEMPTFLADPDQLTQVLMNLFINARHALAHSDPPRQLTVRAYYDTGQERVQVRVADNGPGIPEPIRSRIFDPFFTTKPAGEGTGVGLSVCHGILQAHGGSLEVDTPCDGGTVFILTLPVQSPPASAPERVFEAGCESGRCRVLVVDDEPEVARTLADILGAERHPIDTAANGRDALVRLATQDYDLILCDLRMPVMDGPTLYAELQARRPDLARRMVFVTGDTLGEAARCFLDRVGRPVIEKPFVPAEVRHLAARVIAQHAPRRTAP